jgi:uncharacterized protein YjbJ (UPF0337 family)
MEDVLVRHVHASHAKRLEEQRLARFHGRISGMSLACRRAAGAATGRPATSTQEQTMDRDKDLRDRGAENQIEGSLDEVHGKVRSELGDLTDNESEQLKGKAQELKGKAQKNFGKAQQDLDDNV